MKSAKFKIIVFSAVFFGLFLFAHISLAVTYNVSNASQLMSAVSSSNSSGGNSTIILADGTYTLIDTLYVNAPNVSISSQSGNRGRVIIQGDAMSASAKIGNLIRVDGSNFKIENVTLQKSGWHLIQIVGEDNTDNPIIRNCVFRDAYEQMLKITVDLNNTSVGSDGGLVENCLFEYTAGIGPQYYIGGVDGHAVHNWIVRGNTFKNIISPSGSVAEFAVHFWSDSGNNTVERNTIINCDRGIGFGLDGRPNSGGIIRNNMIYHAAGNGQFADTAIALTESPNTQVYNNTIYMENSFSWGIEYRFAATKNVSIINNLSNKPILARDSATATLAKNVTNASASWFKNLSAGDLHLVSNQSAVVEAGQAVSGLTDDFDGNTRPQGSGIDIGADEFMGTATSRKGDLNNDDKVDIVDLGIFLSNWGVTTKPVSDINQDGKVDIVDLGILLSNWG